MNTLKPLNDFISLNKGNMNYKFLHSGDIFEITNNQDFMINSFQGNYIDGSLNNIYLRIFENDAIKAYPLLGLHSNSTVSINDNCLNYSGIVDEIKYSITFIPQENDMWIYKVELSAKSKTVDVIYCQDIGNASKGGILTNELYMSQYINHSVLENENGYIIGSRQNQPQNNCFPYIEQGSINIKAIRYSTDGTQFFGLNYKKDYIPEKLLSNLENKNYQFEFAYIALQTEQIKLNDTVSFGFYGAFINSIDYIVKESLFSQKAKELFDTIDEKNFNQINTPKPNIQIGKPFASQTIKDVDTLFPNKKLCEYHNDELISFFTDKHSHVVTMQKELLTERPHGSIITTNIDLENINSNLITSTNYMYGVFSCQTVVGNTSFHKFSSNHRGLLNTNKNCGQRIYVKLDNKYHLLTLPALYEMGLNYSSWYYCINDDILKITSFVAFNSTNLILQVESLNKVPYEFIITNQLVLGENEFQNDINYEYVNNNKTMRFFVNSEFYKDTHYDLHIGDFDVIDDSIFFNDKVCRNTSLLVLYKNSNSFSLVLEGHLDNNTTNSNITYDVNEEKEKFINFYKELHNSFELSGIEDEKIDIINEISWWYTHNMMVHFAVPHGLEQPGGAAWGTRDVCQGPMEFFLATQKYSLVRNILINIFSHQQSYGWPQWFMFDKYPYNAGECHGDVIFWPLKALSDYIKASGDVSILQVIAPYFDSDKKETIYKHIQKAVECINNRFVYNSGLISYDGGDWDDTLQPADDKLKEKLISAWTVALAYQTLNNLKDVVKQENEDFSNYLNTLANTIKDDFNKYLIKDNVIAGFAYIDDNEKLNIMMHPSDTKTGIEYRLLPMTRSIISKLVDKKQALNNVNTIHEKLRCPDGIRLMNRPANYNGGISTLFKRAEQAANIGREISLQYVHAHIRYIEAMCTLGLSENAWNSLFTINPILINKTVPNARLCQSNLYFSSSDGCFNDRYEYAKNFDKLYNGSVDVKSGWRLYSSGPGIYFNQLISNFLGIRFEGDDIVIDPSIPQSLNGLCLEYNCFGKNVKFKFTFDNVENTNIMIDNKPVDFTRLNNNPYRQSGIKVNKYIILNTNNEVNIILKGE